MYYLEDLIDNLAFELGSVQIAKEDIIKFAQQYDPQPFHIDDDAGKRLFGGIIASGWHTASLFQRLLVDNFLHNAACMASPGVDQLRFLKPVYADDTLSASMVVTATRSSNSKPDRGVATLNLTMLNQHSEPVLSMVGTLIIARRPTP